MKKSKRETHLWKLLLGAAIVIAIVVLFRVIFPPKTSATVISQNYPNPTAECPVTTPQGFKLGVLAYRWVLTGETETEATFKLQLDVNPSNNENWQNVGVTRTVSKSCLTPTPVEPTPTVDPCLQVSKDVVEVDPCITPTEEPTPTVTEAPHQHVSDGLTDEFSCTKRDCSTKQENKVVNQSGQPLMAPSKSSK